MSFDFKMSLTGIGPHSNTELSCNMSSISMALYADNGSGKSFISKSFKRISDLNHLDKENQEQINLLAKRSSAMVRFGDAQGTLSLSIKPGEKPSRDLSVKFCPNSLPVVSDNTGLIFHVFNSEYVRENLEAVQYHPEDKVRGFILGKSNIDLSQEKKQLEAYENQELIAIDEIKSVVNAAHKELKALGVQSNTKEFISISLENIQKGEETSENREYSLLLEKYSLLKSMPDNLPDVFYQRLSDNVDIFLQDLKNANEIIEHEYTLSSFSEDFKKKFKENQVFIEAGLELSNGKECPFCGQKYNGDALSLIDDYNLFLKDEEAKIIKAINSIIAKIKIFSENLSGNKCLLSKSSNEYNKIKMYLPSFSESELIEVDISNIQQYLEKICDSLDTKKGRINLRGDSIQPSLDQVQAGLNEYKQAEARNIEKVQELNQNKNSINAERLILRKALCNSKFNQIIARTENIRKDLALTRLRKESLSKEIEEKENQVRIDKRKKVVEKLKEYLTIFFKDKYDFDEDQFCVIYQNRTLIENADFVLSDGEKSILAFCFFLANIHGIVEKESDYKKLFLIIDDPVSSMDFNYVYNVAQAIRNLKKEPGISPARYLILTHNMEFMSILVRNKIVSKKFLLSDGKISDFKDDYVMPYTANLLDIYKVSNRTMKPTHTIPNQIRHVLETIYRFEGSCGNFDDYIRENEILSKSGCLYSLIEDLSHGGLRTSAGYTDETLIDSCTTVINFIFSKYPGQVEEVKSLSMR